MTVKSWAENVNKRILRSTSWNTICGFIEDETRSGKRKRRLAHSLEKRVYSVTMRFTHEEYLRFKEWVETDLYYGTYGFTFPQIDNVGDQVYKTYRFTSDGMPQYSNPSGDFVECSMKWEEM